MGKDQGYNYIDNEDTWRVMKGWNILETREVGSIYILVGMEVRLACAAWIQTNMSCMDFQQ